jgi:hypothetical protein
MRGSSVGIATGYLLSDLGSIPCRGKIFFLHSSQIGHLSDGYGELKGSGCEGDHSSPASTEVKIYLHASYIPSCLIYTSMSHIHLHASYIPTCLIYTFMPHIYLHASYIPLCLIYTFMPHIYLHASYTPPCLIYTSMPHIYLHVIVLN